MRNESIRESMHGQKTVSTDCRRRRRHRRHHLHRPRRIHNRNQYMSDEFGVVVVAPAVDDGGGAGGTKAMDMTRA